MSLHLISAADKRKQLEESRAAEAVIRRASAIDKAKAIIIGEIEHTRLFPFRLQTARVYDIIGEWDFPMDELKEWLEDAGYTMTLKWWWETGNNVILTNIIDMIK